MARAAARSDEGYPARDGRPRRRSNTPSDRIQMRVRISAAGSAPPAEPLLPCCSRSGADKRLLELRPLLDGTATPAPSTFPMPAMVAPLLAELLRQGVRPCGDRGDAAPGRGGVRRRERCHLAASEKW